MSDERKTIREITRTLTSLDGTESFVGQDDTGDFQATLKNLILNIEHPVGSFYTQYPDAKSNDAAVAFPTAYAPTTLFGGTWELQFDDEGICFYTEPNISDTEQTRTTGLQEDQMQGHYHQGYFGSPNIASAAGYGNMMANETKTNIISNQTPIKEAITDAVNGTPRTGTTTKGRNRLVRIWKRTA